MRPRTYFWVDPFLTDIWILILKVLDNRLWQNYTQNLICPKILKFFKRSLSTFTLPTVNQKSQVIDIPPIDHQKKNPPPPNHNTWFTKQIRTCHRAKKKLCSTWPSRRLQQLNLMCQLWIQFTTASISPPDGKPRRQKWDNWITLVQVVIAGPVLHAVKVQRLLFSSKCQRNR